MTKNPTGWRASRKSTYGILSQRQEFENSAVREQQTSRAIVPISMGLMRASFVLAVALCAVTVPSCASFITPVPQSFSKGPTWTLTPAIVKPLPREPTTSLTSSFQSVLHADTSYCLAAVMLLSTFGLSLERRTVLGKALSAPLATMALALSVANLRLITLTSPVYGRINQCIVPNSKTM